MIKNNPKISVIVPVYNVKEYLSRCVDSILAQTFSDFELLLIDDGSKDRSAQICDDYATRDTRIRVFHKENGGVSSARNLGLDNAHGEYVIFSDSDDYYCMDDCLEQLYNVALNNHLDIVRGEYIAVDKDGNELPQRRFVKERLPWAEKTLYSDEFVKNVLRGEFFMVLMLMKRSKVAELRFPINQVFLEDMNFLMHLFQKGMKCRYIPLTFYAYRKNQMGASCSYSIKNMLDSFAMCDVFAQLSENTDRVGMRDYCRYNSVMMYYWSLDSMSQRYNTVQREQIIKEANLLVLQKKTQKRKHEWHIRNKSLIVLFADLRFAIHLLRIKAWMAHFRAIIKKNL